MAKMKELDFVFKGVNYMVQIDGTYEDYSIAKVEYVDEQADVLELDGDLPKGLEDRIADEYAELLSTGTGY